jgi:chromosome segregation ATPase
MNPYRHLLAIALGTLAALLMAAGVCAADPGKVAELQRALEEIRRAEQTVQRHAAQALELRSQLMQEGEGLKAEVRDEQRRHAVQTYPGALQVRRIDYNLRLLQRLNGYVEQIDARLAEFQTLMACFERHRERIRDELRMVRALRDAEIGRLLQELAVAIEDAAARCAAPLIVLPAAQRPIESIWAEVVQGR